MNLNIKSAPATENETCPYKNLWHTVIHHAWQRALVNESRAVSFFTAKGGRFSELCVLLDLPEELVREQLLARIKRRRNDG